MVAAWWSVLALLLFVLNFGVAAGQPRRVICPSRCLCRSDFQRVKCVGWDHPPKGSFTPKVKELDLRSAQITVIKEGSFEDYPNLRRLYLAGNPFDCRGRNLKETQKELLRLLNNGNLSEFDGSRLLCATPYGLKWKRILFLRRIPRTGGVLSDEKLVSEFKRLHGPPSVLITIVVIVVVFVLVLVGLAILYFNKDRVFKFMLKRMNTPKKKRTTSQRSSTILNHSLGQDAKPYQQVRYVQLPAGDHRWFPDLTGYEGHGLGMSNTIPKSNVTLDMRDKMAMVRRQSKGYPAAGESSDEES